MREWKQVLGRVEMVLFDLKQMDPERHLAETGIRLEKVLASARFVGRSKVTAWVRTPVIPGHTESEENVRAIARFIRKEMPNVERYDLLAFSKLCVSKYEGLAAEYPLARSPLVARSYMERLHEIAAAEGVRQVVWSGMTAKE